MNPEVDKYMIDGCMRCKYGGTPQCKVNNWREELEMLGQIADRIVTKVDNTEIAQKSLEETGVKDFTISGNDIILLRFKSRDENGDVDKEADLKSKNDFLELLIKITNKIEENGGQYKKPRTETIQSEYVDDQRRNELIDGLRQSLRLQQRGSSLDNALQQAAERTKAYSEWKEKTRRWEDEVGDYVDTKEYAEYKKLRVKQLDSAITGKELTAI